MNGYKIAQIHNIYSALTSVSEEFEGLKPTDCLPSVWSMFLHNLHGTMISGSSFMIGDRLAIFEFGTDSYITKPTKSWKGCNSEAKFVYNDAAPAKDLEENICRLIQPLECENYRPTIYHWYFLLTSYKTTKVNQSARSFDMRISNWTFRRE